MRNQHIPVMPIESLEHLHIQEGGIYIDATLGLGGHSRMILERGGRLIAFERDAETLALTREALSEYAPQIIALNHARFSTMVEYLQDFPEREQIKGVFFDLGISSRQLDNPEYGLSFSENALDQELNMQLDDWCLTNAAEILNKWSEKKLSDMFFELADYPKARRLASLVIKTRPFRTIGEFVELCKQCGRTKPRLHPATLPLMALRIQVNDEFGEIEKAVSGIIEYLEPGARIAVLSFHSGEDRLIKQIFRSSPHLEEIGKKPFTPSPEEIQANPRARSAKLRAAVKKGAI